MTAFIKSLKRGDLHGWRVLKKERMSKCKTTIKKQCHSERSEESRVHQVGVTEILRYALDDRRIWIIKIRFEQFHSGLIR